MSATGLDVFDTTLHKTNSWLNDAMQVLDWPDRHKAYLALKATLHALRDRLTIEEVAQFGAQLPMLIRGFYYEGWDPTGKPLRQRHQEEFLAGISREFRDEVPDGAKRSTADTARAVFTVIAGRVTEGEVADIRQMLPAELRTLWPADA